MPRGASTSAGIVAQSFTRTMAFKAGASIGLALPVRVPADLPSGSYQVSVEVTDNSGSAGVTDGGPVQVVAPSLAVSAVVTCDTASTKPFNPGAESVLVTTKMTFTGNDTTVGKLLFTLELPTDDSSPAPSPREVEREVLARPGSTITIRMLYNPLGIGQYTPTATVSFTPVPSAPAGLACETTAIGSVIDVFLF